MIGVIKFNRSVLPSLRFFPSRRTFDCFALGRSLSMACFCSQKPSPPNPQPNHSGKEVLDPNVRRKLQMINNVLGRGTDHSLKKQLANIHQKYNKQKQELKESILFQDLLKKQINILIYDTQGKPFYSHLLRVGFYLLVVGLLYWSLGDALKSDPKFKVFMQKTTQGKVLSWVVNIIALVLVLRVLHRHRRTKRNFVEKIVYNTQTENFTLTRRTYWCTRRQQEVSRFKILYTENPFLNNAGVNYINIDTAEMYSIGYSFAWKKEDLWSHLISQRIKK